jgi:hypothetical protein
LEECQSGCLFIGYVTIDLFPCHQREVLKGGD